MTQPTDPSRTASRAYEPTARTRRVGSVSYLNATPLISGLDREPGVDVRVDVPSALLDDLLQGEVDVALCPVIDYFRADQSLKLVPAGGIGCDGPTLTVRLYSKVPIEQITTLHADTDSHTSVALVQVLLRELFDVAPRMIDYCARESVAEGRIAHAPESVLLIGDKVVTGSPLAVVYPHQLDLGEAWHRLTGLPFVFAIWMARASTELGTLPAVLADRLDKNLPQVVLLAEQSAKRHGWPTDLAEHYLRDVLRYRIGPRELEAITRFGELAHKHGLIDSAKPLEIAQPTGNDA
ncbi:MAG: menaquinone biosynthetic enzyme MqnA/MqnD family protein [Phycisphaerales bacterium JB063]